jgi:hypothetical protein
MNTNIDNLLGRIAGQDQRNQNFPLRAVIETEPPTIKPYEYYAGTGWWGKQGGPHCVGYSWVHWLHSSPLTYPELAPIEDPIRIYNAAQLIDEWEGTEYDGTSVGAGAKVLHRLGYIESYHWGYSVPDLLACLQKQPVVIGVNWYSGMLNPVKGRIYATGSVVGGHAIIVDGYNVQKEIFRMKNSWGRDWGNKGYCTISFEDMAKLISEAGEICLAIEKRVTTQAA